MLSGVAECIHTAPQPQLSSLHKDKGCNFPADSLIGDESGRVQTSTTPAIIVKPLPTYFRRQNTICQRSCSFPSHMRYPTHTLPQPLTLLNYSASRLTVPRTRSEAPCTSHWPQDIDRSESLDGPEVDRSVHARAHNRGQAMCRPIISGEGLGRLSISSQARSLSSGTAYRVFDEVCCG